MSEQTTTRLAESLDPTQGSIRGLQALLFVTGAECEADELVDISEIPQNAYMELLAKAWDNLLSRPGLAVEIRSDIYTIGQSQESQQHLQLAELFAALAEDADGFEETRIFQTFSIHAVQNGLTTSIPERILKSKEGHFEYLVGQPGVDALLDRIDFVLTEQQELV